MVQFEKKKFFVLFFYPKGQKKFIGRNRFSKKVLKSGCIEILTCVMYKAYGLWVMDRKAKHTNLLLGATITNTITVLKIRLHMSNCLPKSLRDLGNESVSGMSKKVYDRFLDLKHLPFGLVLKDNDGLDFPMWRKLVQFILLICGLRILCQYFSRPLRKCVLCFLQCSIT